ncbi:MAG: adenosylcobinamide-GDP ribazoletransferase [Deltaproteobacteria bacterium]|nr:adenosylcobinamide-GDP ribazoletransferase [Deltaproteobacteria bacterium]
MRDFLTALGFLTLFPHPQYDDFEGKDLGCSMAAFPLVGLFLGIILVISDFILSSFLPEGLTNILLIALLVILTGGLHLDGFMDTLDGIGGGNNREKILAIMRDSRVGAFGAIGIIFLVIIKWEALNSLGSDVKTTALLLMPLISRWAMALLTHISPYARAEGLGRPFADGLTRERIYFALASTLVISLFLFGFKGIVIVFIIIILSFVLAGWFRNKIGGITGDVIGAWNELAELLVLLLILFFT